MPKSTSQLLWQIPLLLFLTALASPSLAQESAEPRFLFDTGVPPWKGERIELPPGFAPDLGWKGIEQIRFAPGMFNPDAPDFFSYVIAFLLAADADTSETVLERELLTYYRGLSKAVMGRKGQTVDTAGFTVSLEKSEIPEGSPATAKDVTAYSGSLEWIEPFATQKAQTLHLEIFVWKHGGQPVVLSCVSPIDPEEELPWKKLRGISSKFRLEP